MLIQFSLWEKQLRHFSENLEKAKGIQDTGAALEAIRDLSSITETMCHDLREKIIREYDALTLSDIDSNPLPLPTAPNVAVTLEEKLLTIRTDTILPFATKGPAYYLHQQLDDALAELIREQGKTVPLFSEPCAIVFLHHYARQGRRYLRRQLRDYDNVEHRAVLNALCRYCVWDDSPLNIISMDALVPGEGDFCEILVMPTGWFPEYIQSEKAKQILHLQTEYH